MRIQDHLKWNPAVPLLLLVIMSIRAHARGFPSWSVVCMVLVGFWLVMCIYRVLYRHRKRVTAFPPLSKSDLVNRIEKERLEHFDARHFGFVWISDMISKYGYPIGMMFRDEPPDKTFSGWTFVSGHEDDWRFGNDIDLHDPQAILRCDPSIEKYLDLPPGVVLSRQPDGTFAKDDELPGTPEK